MEYISIYIWKPYASKRRRMGIIVKTLNNKSFLDFLFPKIKTINTDYDP